MTVGTQCPGPHSDTETCERQLRSGVRVQDSFVKIAVQGWCSLGARDPSLWLC